LRRHQAQNILDREAASGFMTFAPARTTTPARTSMREPTTNPGQPSLTSSGLAAGSSAGSTATISWKNGRRPPRIAAAPLTAHPDK